jgi:hypothetical protein
MKLQSRKHCAPRTLVLALMALTAPACDADDPATARGFAIVKGPIIVLETDTDTSTSETDGDTSDGTTAASGCGDLGCDGGGSDSGDDDSGGDDSGGDDSGDDDSGGSDTGDVCPLVPTEFEEHVYIEGSELSDSKEPPKDYPPGWTGTMELPTPTQCNHQFWIDSDGVDPETAGCHQEWTKDCAKLAAGVVGEACNDADELVETNPAAGKCHGHANGLGHPDLFSCNQYCLIKYEVTGSCQATQNTCGAGVHSAYCRCDF